MCPVSSESLCRLGDPVKGLASLLWVWCTLGPSFLAIYNTVLMPVDQDPFCFVQSHLTESIHPST